MTPEVAETAVPGEEPPSPGQTAAPQATTVNEMSTPAARHVTTQVLVTDAGQSTR